MLVSLLHLAPIGLVLALILLARRPPVQAALTGVVLAALLWVAGVATPFSLGVTQAILSDTMVLFLSTASVILPGLAFVILVERAGAPQVIGAWVRALGWPSAAQVLFVVLGLAPLLEAMTGFGVSLIATVPLLMSLFSRPVGMRMALGWRSCPGAPWDWPRPLARCWLGCPPQRSAAIRPCSARQCFSA